MLVNKNILLISPEPWNHIFVSKHHYAIQLASRGNNVFFLNPPGGITQVAETAFSKVFEVHYKGFPKGLRFYPAFAEKRLIRQIYKDLERMCSVNFDVVWSFDNSVFYDFSALPPDVLKISHIVDYNQDFQTRKASATADFCFCTTRYIQENLSHYSSNVYLINHGHSTRPSNAEPGNFKLNKRTKALYAGNLSIPFIDWVALSEVVKDNRDVDFVFVGPGAGELNGDAAMRSAKEFVAQRPNVSFTGAVSSDKLHRYYEDADILLIAYQEKYQPGQVANPHKMMEYLASGKVVVATKTSQYLNFDPLVMMSDKNSEYPDLFRMTVNDLIYYNSPAIREKRMAFASDNTYERQILRVEKVIKEASLTQRFL